MSPGLTGVLAGFPAVGEVTEDHIRVRAVKRGLLCGSASIQAARTLVDAFRGRLDLVPVSAAEAELSSANAVIHGPLLVAHLTQLSHSTSVAPQLLYRGPQLETGAAFAEAVDSERVALGAALGLSTSAAG